MIIKLPIYIEECIELLGGPKNITTDTSDRVGVILNYRDTGEFMGIYLTDGKSNFLPTDYTRREIIKIINSVIISSGFITKGIEFDTILL